MIRWRRRVFGIHLIVLGHVVGLGFSTAHAQGRIEPQDTTAAVPTDLRPVPRMPLAAVARHDSSGAGLSANAATRPSGGNPLWQIPVTSLSTTRERPIFSPSRRPPPTVNAPIAPSKPLAVAGPDRPPLSLV